MDRSTFGGLVMLLAFVILGMGLWELLVDGSSEGWSTLIVGGGVLLIGFFTASWDIWRGSSGSSGNVIFEEVEGNLGEINAREKAEREAQRAAEAAAVKKPGEPEDKRFTIHQTGGEGAVDAAREVLAREPRITSIVEEGGRWYSVPDGDDLPEWNALRIYCTVDDLDGFMDEMRALLKEKLSAEDYGELTIAHY